MKFVDNVFHKRLRDDRAVEEIHRHNQQVESLTTRLERPKAGG